MAVTPVYNWRLPDGPVAANGPQAFANLATDIEATLAGVGVSTYTPSWTSDGSQQPANPSSKVGKYRLANGWCDFSIYIGFGASVSGGKGRLALGLPVAASSSLFEQVVRCKLWVPAIGNWDGIGLIPAGSSSVWPLWTVASNNSTITYWRNNDDNNNPGTGYPQIPGHWTCESGGNVVVSGRYLVS
jgi:hypothetical protein